MEKSQVSRAVQGDRWDCVTAYTLVKGGNDPKDCEDVCGWDTATGRFALADGATESSFAQEWGEMLVAGFLAAPRFAVNVDPWVRPLQQQWAAQLQGRSLSWFAKRKAQLGAHATFLGLEVAPQGQWRAIALGDSCLFWWRNGQLLEGFPLKSSAAFGYGPPLLTSVGTNPPARLMAGQAQPGDEFWLVSDALAQWVWQQIEGAWSPWSHSREWVNAEAFAQWVEQTRATGHLHNDDTALLRIAIPRYT
ncbi:MAG TPA: hypothetical protein DCQ32_06170 [Cyanobacteria bacterium UBA8156]|jgi:hypothetical protein|nr:hypothetical protein [Cyanobacteria bacterium UBA8156]